MTPPVCRSAEAAAVSICTSCAAPVLGMTFEMFPTWIAPRLRPLIMMRWSPPVLPCAVNVVLNWLPPAPPTSRVLALTPGTSTPSE